MVAGCVLCREESDGKINTNLVEQKLRTFSTKVGCCGHSLLVVAVLCATPAVSPPCALIGLHGALPS